MDVPDSVALMSDDQWQEIKSKLSSKFTTMMKALFRQKCAQLDINILASDQAQDFITSHASVLDSSFQKVKMTDTMRQRLTRSNYIFSGIKTFHELNEAFPSLLDENGDRKPFERFLNDVQSINDTYNSNYLHSEYNFIQASASMAAKWEQFAEDGDRYFLQYRTAHDGKVRPEHAALEGVTLPMSDPFWETYYPPNGWNCRCTVTQVRKQKYPATPHDEAMQRGQEALGDEKYNIFRFNSGKQGKAMPDYNPYTIRRCNDCDVAKGGLTLSAPDNEVCAACKCVRACVNIGAYDTDKVYGERLKISKHADSTEVEENTRAARAMLSSFPNMTAQIRRHVFLEGVKNPEYLINDMLGDRKGILSPKGIQSGFKKAIAQGCEVVVIDLDANMRERKLPVSALTKYLFWRSEDFKKGIIKECYVVYHDKAVRITDEHKDRNSIRAEIEKLRL